MASTPWKAYTSNGRNYWVHAETKKSVWELPEELVKLKAEHGGGDDVEMKEPTKPFFPPPATALAAAAVASPTRPVATGATPPTGPRGLRQDAAMSLSPAVPAGAGGLPQTPHGHGLPDGPVSTSGHSLAIVSHGTPAESHPSPGTTRISPQPPLAHDLPLGPPSHQQQARDGGWRDGLRDRYVIPDKGWQTLEQAEEAFEYLLQKANVEASWTWDVAMRAIITDPLYKSLHTLAEKKVVFNRVRRQNVAIGRPRLD
jgi:pre-mRNA-processing factor 40